MSLDKIFDKINVSNIEGYYYICRLCKLEFNDIQYLYEHLKKSHQLKSDNWDRYVVKKRICKIS